MEKRAHATLRLRSFYRQFPEDMVPLQYYQYLRGKITFDDLFSVFPREAEKADQEAVNATLGDKKNFPPEAVDELVRQRLGKTASWVLIGGPPCQAYSIAGRSRMRPVDRDKFEKDDRHRLYREYLRILAVHQPPVFVMENVKGLLSATLKGKKTFERIREDLSNPVRAVNGKPRNNRRVSGHEYDIYPLNKGQCNGGLFGEWRFRPADYIIECERYAVPQARHRVILLGVRRDLDATPRPLVPLGRNVGLREVISDLPPIRSELSNGCDSTEEWVEAVRRLVSDKKWLARGDASRDLVAAVHRRMHELDGNLDPGAEFISHSVRISYERDWFYDSHLRGVCNHTGRRHMPSDLLRYFFAACFAEVHGRSPKVGDFPRTLWPRHKNVNQAVKSNMFADRFRIQLWDEPATTITSHMAKDGHHFIHPDPFQCRSLTVREAARIQTFPDNYFFAANRTQHYTEVGNTVP